MFQILENPQFDFMKRGQPLLVASGLLVAAAVVVLFVNGLNLGIEFTGGTEVQIKYADSVNVATIRSTLERAGIAARVTTIGDPTENEIYIRLSNGAEPGEAGRLTGLVADALRAGAVQGDKLDVNIAGQTSLRDALLQAPEMDPERAAALAQAILTQRKEVVIYHSVDDLATVPGLTAELLDFLRERSFAGPLALRSQSYIGPAIGEELMDKAKLAILLSLIMMLIYIWIRFQFQWGFAAVIALTHDTLITLGLFSLFGKEMSLPVVAAFLTLVGYSVNDTVVVFDRIRENLKNRAAPGLEATVNLSINQTLGRTIITSGLTWIVVFGLYMYGGPALESFAFVLSVGVIVGTYSSIYIASPVLLLWDRLAGGKVPAGGESGARVVRRAKKVRIS